MSTARFDSLARAFAAAPSRRELVGLTLSGLGLGSAFRLAQPEAAGAQVTTPAASPAATPAPDSVCVGVDVPDLQSRPPGELIAFEEITPAADPSFPAAARAWRVLYVSTGRDNTERILVCGVVLAPADLTQIWRSEAAAGATGRVVAWAHGTLGLVQRCQPSTDPASEIWGPTPYGFNTVAWGSAANDDVHTGEPAAGIIAGIIANGWLVAATDYVTEAAGQRWRQPYVSGKIQAANIIDNIRAAHQLVTQLAAGYSVSAYDVVTWGHSQGGHAALWAGQLLESYAAATATPDGPSLALAGVALEAPGSTFLTLPDQPGTALGFGLLDWMTHAELQLTGQDASIPLAPFLMSYLFGSWALLSAAGPADATAMPAYPATGPLDLTALVVPEARETVAQFAEVCWMDGAPVATLAQPYLEKPFLQATLAEGAVIDGFQHGNFDATCAGDPPPAVAAWCAWLRYNLPGPLGDHPLATLPRRGDALAPILLTTGLNDGVLHCVSPATAENVIPPAQDCLAVALYDALAGEYCPNGAAAGALTMLAWRSEAGITVADHSDITGLAAAASVNDLTFTGSPLGRFFDEAFAGTMVPGCSATVVNAADA